MFKAAQFTSPAAVKSLHRPLRAVDDSRGWVSIFSSSLRHLGFQSNRIEVNRDSVFAQTTFFSCVTLIAGDVAKLRAKLVELVDGIWKEVASPAFSPVLRKPNHYQTWQQFIECWITSKLGHGNTYVLKVRDARRVVVALYVLDPLLVRPLVAESGEVFYSVQQDDLSLVFDAFDGPHALPASEIIHDRFNCLFHPLVGLSPLFASGLAATQALEIANHSANFWKNSGRPGGILTAPGEISDATAARAKEYFESNFTGENSGRVAVLADGLKFEAMSMKSVDAQLVEQLKLSAEQVCAPFHVPAYMVGAAPVPPNNNVEALNLAYYSQCLQALIEAIENCLDVGLGLGPMADGRTLGVELDLDGLLRMDTTALTTALSTGVRAGLIAPNEGRRRLSLPPVEGGNTPFLQHQDYPINLLANREPPEDGGPAPAGVSRAASRFIKKGRPDVDAIEQLIIEEVRKAVAALPAARDGKDGTPGRDGTSVSREEVLAMVRTEVADVAVKHLEAMPKPRDGVDGAPGRDGRDLSIQEADTLLERHFDRRIGGLFDKAFEDRIEQIATKASLLVPPGRDGQPGAPGRPGTPGEDGRDGKDGADGRDGISADDLRVELVGRNLTIVLRKDGKTLASRSVLLKGLPAYTGTYVHGKKYAAGDMATYGGSVWCAKVDTNEPPKGEANAWQLCVKGAAR